MTKECKQQFTLRISQANKTEMIVILYEMTLAYIEDAVREQEDGNRPQFVEAVRRIRACIKELMNSLNLQYEPAPALLQLYIYCNRELVLADIRNQTAPLFHVQKIIKKLHEAYEELAKQDESEPVMQNSQAVYAGFTYGKNCLAEDMADQGMNRGLRV